MFTSTGDTIITECFFDRQRSTVIGNLTDWLFNWLVAGLYDDYDNVSDLASLTFGRRYYE